MFWSENELQTLLDRGKTPLPNAIHPGALNAHYPLTVENYIIIAFVKLLAITITLVAGFPGGIIYPLFFAG